MHPIQPPPLSRLLGLYVPSHDHDPPLAAIQSHLNSLPQCSHYPTNAMMFPLSTITTYCHECGPPVVPLAALTGTQHPEPLMTMVMPDQYMPYHHHGPWLAYPHPHPVALQLASTVPALPWAVAAMSSMMPTFPPPLPTATTHCCVVDATNVVLLWYDWWPSPAFNI